MLSLPAAVLEVTFVSIYIGSNVITLFYLLQFLLSGLTVKTNVKIFLSCITSIHCCIQFTCNHSKEYVHFFMFS